MSIKKAKEKALRIVAESILVNQYNLPRVIAQHCLDEVVLYVKEVHPSKEHIQLFIEAYISEYVDYGAENEQIDQP